MRAILTVDVDGAAFGPGDDDRGIELARILRKLAGAVEVSGDVADRWTAHDMNGNRVGELRIEDASVPPYRLED